MNTALAQSLIVALIAGLAAALMSGLVVPSSASILFLSLLAPAPLMIAGFGWHPLVAALGGLVAALLVQYTTSTIASVMAFTLLAAPAYGITALAQNRFSMLSGRPQRDGKEMGGIGVMLVIFLALAGVIAAMMIEPDFSALERRLRAAMAATMQVMIGTDAPLPAARAAAMENLYDILVRFILPMSSLVSLVTLVVSATMAAQVADRAGMLRYPRPDFRRFRVPGGAMILSGLALLVASRPGYLGALGDMVLAGMLVLFLLQGLAVIHARTLGLGGRGILLFFAWGSLIVFGFPALVFVLVGLADHLLDFRRPQAL